MHPGWKGIRSAFQQVVIAVSFSMFLWLNLSGVGRWDEKTQVHKGIMLIYGTHVSGTACEASALNSLYPRMSFERCKTRLLLSETADYSCHLIYYFFLTLTGCK